MTSRPNKTVVRPKFNLGRIKPPEGSAFRLRIGGAHQPREDSFLGLDTIKTDSVDYVVELKKFPWPIDDSVCDTIFSYYYYHRLRRDERYAFVNECYRILKPAAQLILCVPHWSSMRSITDPFAEWPPLCESSFMLYSNQWRIQEKVTIPVDADFGGSYGYGHSLDPDIAVRNDDYQALAKKHYLNAILDLHVTMTKS